MTEMTVAMPLSGEEVVEAIVAELRARLYGDCHLNPALAYMSFECQATGAIIVKDNGRDETIRFEIHLEDRPPNVVRQASGQAIPTLVEDSQGKKEFKNVKYTKMSAQSGPGGTQPDPAKGPPNPHPAQTPEHEKQEKERKEREEKERKEKERR